MCMRFKPNTFSVRYSQASPTPSFSFSKPDQKDNLLYSAPRRGLQRLRFLLQLFEHVPDTPMFGPLSGRELSQGLEPQLDERSSRHQQEKAIRTPFGIEHLGGDVRVLEGIAPQVEKLREPQRHKRLLPRIYSFPALLHEMDLPVAVAERHEVTFITPIEDSRARVLLHLTPQEWNEVVSVEMDLEGLGASLVAFLNFLDNIRLARRCQQRWQHVLVREDVVRDCARLDDARPPDGARHAPSALPVRVLLPAKRRGSAIGPTQFLSAVVGRVHHNGVLSDPQLVEFGEELSDVTVVLDHAVGINAQSSLALGLLLQVPESVHPGRIPPAEEGLAGLVLALDEVQGSSGNLSIDGLHALPGQRAGIFDLLRTVRLRPGVQDAARPKSLLEFGILWVVRILRLLLCVQMVEVAKELVETMNGWQELVPVAKMIFAELASRITQG